MAKNAFENMLNCPITKGTSESFTISWPQKYFSTWAMAFLYSNSLQVILLLKSSSLERNWIHCTFALGISMSLAWSK